MADANDTRAAAIKRLENKRAFWQHLAIYLVVNAFLVLVWAVTSRGYFWPVWIIGPWGIGLALHTWNAFFQRPISEADIQREMRRGDTVA